MAKRAVKLITEREYDVLVYAPDRLTPVPLSYDRRTIKGLATRGLIDYDAEIVGFRSERWRINDFGRLMIEACKREWKLQGELGI